VAAYYILCSASPAMIGHYSARAGGPTASPQDRRFVRLCAGIAFTSTRPAPCGPAVGSDMADRADVSWRSPLLNNMYSPPP